ncbi:MAG TPA: hypothetical protein VNQ55_09600, partial [Parapedobacter sp.]|nr:hypothetical protein [Parapedobacter sp.]
MTNITFFHTRGFSYPPSARHAFIFLAFFVCSVASYGQQTVRGTVVDESGSAVVGATVTIESTGRSTVTDADG